MTHRLMTHRRRTLAGGLLAAVLVIGACGGDDDEPAATDAPAEDDPVATDGEEFTESDDTGDGGDGDDAPPPTEAADEPEPEPESNDDSDPDDRTVIDDFGDLPSECVDLMGDFLRQIEPDIAAVDWDNATLADLEPLDEVIAVPSDEFDRRATELGCDEFEFGLDDDQSLEFVIRVAEQEAPGTIPWLEFVANLSSFADDIGNPTDPDSDTGSPPSADGDLPTDCEGTKQLLLSAAEQYGSIDEIPIAEAMELTSAITNVMTVCPLEEALAFLEDPTILAFLDS